MVVHQLKSQKKEIQPGEQVEVISKVNFGNTIGKRKILITIDTDYPETPRIELQMLLAVESPLAFSKDTLYFGRILPGEIKTKKIQLIKQDKQKDIQIKKIKIPNEHIKVSLLTDNNQSNDKKVFLISVTGKKEKSDAIDTILFQTDSNELPDLPLKVMSQHQGIFEANPSLLIFRPTDKYKEVKVSIKAENINSELKAEIVSDLGSSCPISLYKVKTGEEIGRIVARIKLKFDSQKYNTKSIRSSLKIRTGDHEFNIPIIVLD